MSIIVELHFFAVVFAAVVHILSHCCKKVIFQISYLNTFFVEVWKKFYLHPNHPDEKKTKQSTIEIMWLLKVANLLRRC